MNTTVGIISALSGILLAASTVIGGATVLLRELRRNTAVTRDTNSIVNGRHTALLTYQAILINTLNTAGVPVPVNPQPETGELES